MKKIIMAMVLIVCFLQSTIQVAFAEDLTGRVVILDPGHGYQYNVYAGYDEGLRMLELANLLKPLLEEKGATVYMTRTDGSNPDLATRSAYANILSLEFLLDVKQAELENQESAFLVGEIAEIQTLLDMLYLVKENPETYASTYLNTPYDYTQNTYIHPQLQRVFSLQADEAIGNHFLFLSLHSNATPFPTNSGASGTSAYCIDTQKAYYQGYSYAEPSRYFADMILTDLEVLGFANQGVIVDDMHVNREMNLPSILVENGFHTNAYDRAKLQDDQVLEQMAVIYRNAIETYFASSFISNAIVIEKKPVDTFQDIYPTKWYYDGVAFVTEQGILSGVSTTEFAPLSQVNGGMLFSALERLLELEESSGDMETAFLDSLNPSTWYYNAFAWANSHGLLGGIHIELDGAGTPNRSLTRAETAQILYQYISLVMEDLPDVTGDSSGYKDAIPSEYMEAVLVMEAMGLMSGDTNGNFVPSGTITRAELANILSRLYPLLELDVDETEVIEEGVVITTEK